VLNIADGLLGRMLKLHLLCSVNARLDALDPAIQRPGRLMNYRRFEPMPRNRAVALASLQGVAFSPEADVEEFTLAQVLQPSPVETKQEQRSIGFAAK
jgi:ATP-dependent 26S proteasome regulatory subunit